MSERPPWFRHLQDTYPKVLQALEQLGQATHAAGPLDAKHSHLIQLAAAAACGSAGSMHSHVRRALDAGASPAEIHHALLLLTSTIGWPQVSAAMQAADAAMDSDADDFVE